jgi:protein-tyrosine phosphatase
LFLGGHGSVNNIENLKRLKITHVLNMAQELDLNPDEYMNEHQIKLVNIQAKDARTYNIRSDFDKAFYFIDSALQEQNGRIVINCARGISRSATIVIAYMMFRFNMSLSEAHNIVSRLRPHVRPNSNFRRQLEQFEHELAYLKYMNETKSSQQQQQMKASRQNLNTSINSNPSSTVLNTSATNSTVNNNNNIKSQKTPSGLNTSTNSNSGGDGGAGGNVNVNNRVGGVLDLVGMKFSTTKMQYYMA